MSSTSIYPQELHELINTWFPNYPRGMNLRSNDNPLGKRNIFMKLVEKYTQIFSKYTISESVYLIKNNLHSFHLCPMCHSEVKTPPRIYCSMKCYKKDPSINIKISRIKQKQYSNSEWKNATERKKVLTTLKNHGVEYPMQSPDVFEKHLKNSFSKKENVDNMNLIGYEPYVYHNYLTGTVISGSQFLKDNNLRICWQDENGKIHFSYPDFWSDEEECFIEVKSEYTRKIHDYKIMKAKDAILKMGFVYVIVVAFPKSRKIIIESYFP